MSNFEYGIKRIIYEIIGSITTSTILATLVKNRLLNPEELLLFKIVNTVSIIVLIHAMIYWATLYLIGWLIGLIMLSKVGLVSPIDFVIYFGIPFVILIRRIYKKFIKY